ncbi:MAG: hypothetical protein IPK32_11195 [Verrucomicrobiaceae bacterium]|nr:hypothetical protein [Verrucomicrobiaceae bacterium]
MRAPSSGGCENECLPSNAPGRLLFPEPPPGIVYLRNTGDVFASSDLFAYQHLLLRAWADMKLCGVLVVRGIPTVYLREDERELSPQEVHELQRKLWNQGVATLLVLVDSRRTRIFSAMMPPRSLTEEHVSGEAPLESFVEELGLAAEALRAHRTDAVHAYHTFCRQVTSGELYRRHNPEGKNAAKKFNPREMVDAYLLDQLAAVRNELTRGKYKLDVATAHAFLGRLLFTCYLIDRGIVVLNDEKYFRSSRGKPSRTCCRETITKCSTVFTGVSSRSSSVTLTAVCSTRIPLMPNVRPFIHRT